MSRIQISNLTFAWPGSFDNVFEEVSLAIDTDWKLGLTGRNGRGKTTLLALLQGQLPYQGSIQAAVQFDYFPFEVEDEWQSPASLRESLCPEALEWQLARELGLLGLDTGVLHQPFATLSPGQQTKVLLACLFLRPGHFLLIDEPTNHLDMEARALVSEYLSSKSGFILVSHDRAFLDGCVDHILSINKKSITVQKGGYSVWEENWQLRQQFELGQNQRLQKQIASLTTAAKRTANWSDKVEATKYGASSYKNGPASVDRGYIGHKAAKMMQRAKAIEKRQQAAIEEKRGLLQELEENEPLKLHPLAHPKQLLAEGRELSAAYGALMVFENLRFELRQGQRLALLGPNGCGKSTLLKLVLGQTEGITVNGSFQLASGLIISSLPQVTKGLAGPLAAFEAKEGLDVPLFRAVLRKLGFERVQFEKDMAAYSQGQKKKVALAASLCRPAHLYVWDEPLNYVDLPARQQLEELLLAFKPTLLCVEHDAAFVQAVATDVLDMS